MAESKGSIFPDDRVWYDQFTSTDWVHDNIADAYRVKALRSRKDFWGRVYVMFDGAQGWILSAVVGLAVACVAYIVDVAEATVFDFKDGYCIKGWYLNEKVRRSSPAVGGRNLSQAELSPDRSRAVWIIKHANTRGFRRVAPTALARIGGTGGKSSPTTP